MPSFSFTLAKKPAGKRKTSVRTNEYEVVDTNVVGVVWIDINANYFVHTEEHTYPIKKECYSCKGKSRVYRHGCYDMNRVSYIRLSDNLNECNHTYYIPFAVGCIVSGSIHRNKSTNKLSFNIRKCWIDYDNEDAHKALEFYRQHLNEINDAIVEGKYNGI